MNIFKHKKIYFEMELKKIHEDKRGFIYVVEELLENDKEFSFLEIKKGYARGGCCHKNDEYFVVITGKIKYIHGKIEEILIAGESRKIPALEPHAFIGIEDSIVSEWGITTIEKEADVKDLELRKVVDEINKKIN